MLNRMRAALHYRLGRRAHRMSQYGKALRHLTKSVECWPNDPEALSDRAVELQRIGDHKQAIEDLSRSIELNPQLAITYFNRGISAKLVGNLDLAVSDQEQATRLSNGHHQARAELGCAHLLRGDVDLAVVHLSNAIRLRPGEAEYHKQRGYAHFHAGKFGLATSDFSRSLAIEIDPYAVSLCFIAHARADGRYKLPVGDSWLKEKAWPLSFIDLCLGKIRADDFIASAVGDDQKAEARFYLGQWHLFNNDNAAAALEFRRAVSDCHVGLIERALASAELLRM